MEGLQGQRAGWGGGRGTGLRLLPSEWWTLEGPPALVFILFLFYIGLCVCFVWCVWYVVCVVRVCVCISSSNSKSLLEDFMCYISVKKNSVYHKI